MSPHSAPSACKDAAAVGGDPGPPSYLSPPGAGGHSTLTCLSCSDRHTGTALQCLSSRIQRGNWPCYWSPGGLSLPESRGPLSIQTVDISPQRSRRQDGHRASLGDHDTWVSPDGGFGEDPWKGIRPEELGVPFSRQFPQLSFPRPLPDRSASF